MTEAELKEWCNTHPMWYVLLRNGYGQEMHLGCHAKDAEEAMLDAEEECAYATLDGPPEMQLSAVSASLEEPKVWKDFGLH